MKLFKLSIFTAGILTTHYALAFVNSRTGENIRRWDLRSNNPNVHTNSVNRTTDSIRYYIASDGYSTTNTAAELNAIRATFDQWQSIPGTHLRFEEAGLVSPGVDVNTSQANNTNVVFWAKSSTIVNGGAANISGRLGVTFTSFFSDGTLAQGDIVLNGVEWDWYTDFNNPTSTFQFVESTIAHEIGHFVGLAHSPVGAATMLSAGAEGVDSQAGLSSDEVTGARSLYPSPPPTLPSGAIAGQITKGGSPVLGAAVILESTNGITIAGTASASNGNYTLPALPPATFQLRVVPLDPSSSPDWLVRGRDIASPYFDAADTSFLPTAATTVTVTANTTNTLNVAVTAGNPAFRISNIRQPTANPNSFSWGGSPIQLRPGNNNLTIGVGSPDLPTSGATFGISGDGLTLGPVVFNANIGPGQNFISRAVSVSSNATPGMRTLSVQQGANVAYANGFLEILPLIPDYDFDGLDDRFQRQHFPKFTSVQAEPGSDPDSDTFINSFEYRAGTNPNNSASLLKVERILYDVSGATVIWRSVAGKRYQVYQKPVLNNQPWAAVNGIITANGSTAQVLDSAGISGTRFYRVEVIP